MSLKAIKNKVTSKVGRQILIAQKNSPGVLFAVGAVGVGATVVLACRATLKMEEVLAEAEKNQQQIFNAQALETEDYSEDDAQKDRVNNRVQTAVKITKLYAPAAILGIISIGALTGSHVLLTRRNVALTAAYAALDKGFKEYRERVVSELGKEKDEEFRYGMVEREIAVDTDEGVAVKTVKTFGKSNGRSIYARIFDEYSQNWDPTKSYNQMFIQAQQNYANDKLRATGHLFLNEVYDMLGLPRSKEGAVVGWVKGNGDNYVDFGVFNGNTFMGQQFVNGDEKSIWLDFNVDGVVWDKI